MPLKRNPFELQNLPLKAPFKSRSEAKAVSCLGTRRQRRGGTASRAPPPAQWGTALCRPSCQRRRRPWIAPSESLQPAGLRRTQPARRREGIRDGKRSSRTLQSTWQDVALETSDRVCKMRFFSVSVVASGKSHGGPSCALPHSVGFLG